MATTPDYSSLLGLQTNALPDALKPRKITSYPTAAPGAFNQQAFALAGVPQNYVPPPPPPPKAPTPTSPAIPNIPNINLGGMFGNINLQALLAQYGGLLGGQQAAAPQQQIPATPARPTAQATSPYSAAAIQALLSRYRM